MRLSNKYPIYFDHKLADFVSTYSNIYSGKIIGLNKVIPIITNCEHINTIKDIDEMSPKCPIAPYKISTADFDNNKDNVKYKSSSSSLLLSSLSKRSLNRNFKRSLNRKYEKNVNLVHYNEYITFIENKTSFNNIVNKQIDEIREFIKSKPEEPKKSYEINKTKLDYYYSLLPSDILSIVKKVIDNNIYMPYSIFICLIQYL